ncbi:MFS general substrate transporter [Amylostereum chailletii]|nr:MFS general substrate transporter [Amylostereum chailletii]
MSSGFMDAATTKREDVTPQDSMEKKQDVNFQSQVTIEAGLVAALPTLEVTNTRTKAQTSKLHLHVAVLCWTMVLIGWTDGTTGPLLPRIQDVYNVNFVVVALIFVSNCVGIIFGGISNVYLNVRLGFGKVIVLGSVAYIGGFCIQSAAPPFPVFVLSFVMTGCGRAMLEAHCNGYIASLAKSSTRLGVLHCMYGVGAFVAPLVSTQFAQLGHWSFHYLISLGLAISVLVAQVSIFRLRPQNECRDEIGEVNTAQSAGQSQTNVYSQIFRVKTVHLIAFFILSYVGVEVTVGGWIVTYTIEVRHGGPSSGYISSGFYGGLALGRVALLWVTKKLGNRPAVFTYMFIAIGLEFVVWFGPSLISGAVAILFIGIFLGPIYPIAINEAGRVIPHNILTGSIGWIGAFGTAGSAVVPFVAGVLAQEKGIWTSQPLLISLMSIMVLMWFVMPRPRVSA